MHTGNFLHIIVLEFLRKLDAYTIVHTFGIPGMNSSSALLFVISHQTQVHNTHAPHSHSIYPDTPDVQVMYGHSGCLLNT